MPESNNITLRELIEQRCDSIEATQKMQQKIYEEHFNRLNHSAERLDLQIANSISRKSYQQDHADVIKRLNKIETMESSRTGQQRGEEVTRDEMARQLRFYVSVVGLIILVVNVIAVLLGKQ